MVSRFFSSAGDGSETSELLECMMTVDSDLSPLSLNEMWKESVKAMLLYSTRTQFMSLT